MSILTFVVTSIIVSECTKTHAGGCANYNKVVLATFRENDFTISTCLTKCRTNTRCEGFALGKNRVTGKCILYKSDDQGNQCINDGNKNWDYYSMKDCSGNMILSAIEVLSGPFFLYWFFLDTALLYWYSSSWGYLFNCIFFRARL